MKSIGLFVLIVMMVGCSDVRDTTIPRSMTDWESELKPVVEKLSQEEKELLGQYMMRMKVGEVFGGSGIPPGETVGTAIDKQRKFNVDRQQKEREEQIARDERERANLAIAKQMNEALSVEVAGKRIVGETLDKRLLVTFVFYNRGEKSITGFKGTMVFKDMFGDKITSLELKYNNTIVAGVSVRWTGERSLLFSMDGSDKLASTPLEKVISMFEPEIIIFGDGSRIEVTNESI